jgi:hypothetical protein
VTPYSCEAIAVGPQLAKVDGGIVAPWRELASGAVEDRAWLSRVQAVARRRLPAAMGTEARVRLQHQLLRIAVRIDAVRRDPARAPVWSNAYAEVMALARAIAPTSAELRALGDGARPQVSAILGDRITDRATQSCGSGRSIHVIHGGGLLAFRPLRAGTTRALVAQLVAFDTAGAPHITPLVDGLELRLGDAVSSPACVIHANDDGTLRAATLASIEEHPPFVARSGGGVGCAGCHRDGNTMNARDLTAAEAAEIDVVRDHQVDRLASALWARLSERMPAADHSASRSTDPRGAASHDSTSARSPRELAPARP